MDYINFGPPSPSKSGKTKIWHVQSWRDEPLGEIRWYAQWRRYCFYPIDGDVHFDSACLRILDNFCSVETHEHLT